MGESTTPPAAAPGWYPDPGGPAGQQRYWDGRQWTAVQPAPPPPKSAGGTTRGGKFILGALIAIVLFALITIIGKESDDDSKSTAATATTSRPSTQRAAPATTTREAADTQDRVFFTQLAEYPWFSTVDRGELVEKAHLVCNNTTAGGGDSSAKADVIEMMIDSGFGLKNALGFALASYTAYCPQHLALLR